MADYIYLLENRLSADQRNALRLVRDLARSKNLTVFLVGGAVRDLTSGSPVRDLDVVVQGNAPALKAELEALGAVLTGENRVAETLFLSFPGSVRMELGSALSATWPKPNKPVYAAAAILDDLRRRDFTANAMALSLNEGSYGLLMDPLNGVADIENRELRLVSNYGFIEDPIRMVRAARLMARLGWAMDEKTQSRYDSGKEEGYISSITDAQRGYEVEEIFHEEDPLRVLKRLESEGWLKALAPFWTSAKVDVVALDHLREVQTQLQMQGIHPDASAANFPLLTAKLSASEVATLKTSFVRQGFVREIDTLEVKAKELSAQLTSKAAALPSQAWKIITSAAPEAVLWLAYTVKSPALKAKFEEFYKVWPQARQKIPYTLMQEMRIVPELPGYDELVEKLFFELMDGTLQTPEELKAFLEPYSPPAPPPPVSTRRPRAGKKDSKAAKARAKKALELDDDADSDEESDELPDEAAEDLPDEIEEAVSGALDAGLTDGQALFAAEDPDDEAVAPVEDDTAESEGEQDEAPPPAGRAVKSIIPASKPVKRRVDVSAKSKPLAKTQPRTPTKPTAKAAPQPSSKAKPVATKSAAPKSPAHVSTAHKSSVHQASAKKPKVVAAPAKKAAGKAAKVAVKVVKKTAAPVSPPAKKGGKAAPVTGKTVATKAPAKKPAAKKAVIKHVAPSKSSAKKQIPAKKKR
jgi:tRNA nucleotidyltransferase/poly(A) polymerase